MIYIYTGIFIGLGFRVYAYIFVWMCIFDTSGFGPEGVSDPNESLRHSLQRCVNRLMSEGWGDGG